MSTKTTSEDTNDLDDNNNRKTISWDEWKDENGEALGKISSIEDEGI